MGYKLDLGHNLQGRLEPIQVNDKRGPYRLGFKPTKKDKQQVAAQKRENKLAKLEGRTPPLNAIVVLHQGLKVCPTSLFAENSQVRYGLISLVFTILIL